MIMLERCFDGRTSDEMYELFREEEKGVEYGLIQPIEYSPETFEKSYFQRFSWRIIKFNVFT